MFKRSLTYIRGNYLTIAISILLLFSGFTLGAIGYGAPFEGQTNSGFEFWLHRYQSVIAVIVTLLVASVQIDSSRRQHTANIKRTFKDNIDAIFQLDSYMNYIIALNPVVVSTSDLTVVVAIHDRCPKFNRDKFSDFLPPHIVAIYNDVDNRFHQSINLMNSQDKREDSVQIAQRDAKDCIRQLKEEYSNLSQYWS